MAIRRIMVEIITEDDDLDIDEFIVAIKDACDEVERRPMIAGGTEISVGEFVNG